MTGLRKQIKAYTFEIPERENEKARAHIGVFGEMGAGKSSFINSIEFAYKGDNDLTFSLRIYFIIKHEHQK